MGKTRTRRSVEEKRGIVELTVEPGASVARGAQAEGVNANQVFLWRRAYRNGELTSNGSPSALLPVLIGSDAAGALEMLRKQRPQPWKPLRRSRQERSTSNFLGGR